MKKLLLLAVLVMATSAAHAQCTTAPASFTASVGSTTSTSTTVTWTTSCAASTRVGWSAGARDCCDYYSTLRDTSGTTSHSYTITGLQPNATYKLYACSSGFTGGVPDTNPASSKTTCDNARSVTTSVAPTAATLDYNLAFVGAQHIDAGYSIPIKATLYITQVPSGFTSDNIRMTFTLPTGITVTPFNLTGADTWNVFGTNMLRAYGVSSTQSGKYALVFAVDASVAPGTYNVSIAATTENQVPAVTHTFTLPITVTALGTFPWGTPSSYPTITNKSSWESWMTTYGTFYCAQDYGFQSNPAYATIRPNNSAYTLCGIGVENCSWYYDGAWVYWQVRDYDQAHNLTGNSTQWNQCIANVDSLYRDGYVMQTAGGPGRIPGYTVFPLGETQDWLRNSDSVSRSSVNAMTTSSAFGTSSGTLTNPVALIETDQVRENAYMINACVSNRQNGNVCSDANLNFYINAALGHITQWVTDGSTAFNQPFMSGLECEALYRVYDYGVHDPRIPLYCKATWDWLYANAWQKDSSGSGFWYNNVDYLFGIAHSDMRPLNLMVAPIAARVFKDSGNSTYSTQALNVFNGWVTNGTNNFDSAPYGKTFSQGYRWSFDLIKWLTAPSGGGVTVTISPKSATIPVLGSTQYSATPSGSTFTVSVGCTASISSAGIVTATSQAETCNVNATNSGSSATAYLTVQPFIVSPLAVTLQTNASQQFTANFPANWSVTSGSCTVTNSGLLTAPGSVGSCIVTGTAQNGGATATATVSVVGAPVTSPGTQAIGIQMNGGTIR